MLSHENCSANRTDSLLVLEKLRNLATKHPQLRLGQLIAIIVNEKDLFSIPDDYFLDLINNFEETRS